MCVNVNLIQRVIQVEATRLKTALFCVYIISLNQSEIRCKKQEFNVSGEAEFCVRYIISICSTALD